jgi:hypothetical protein
MRKRIALVAVLCLAGALAVRAQPPKPDANMRDMLLRHWNQVGDQVIKMAEEFPADKYDYKPKPEVRTFADQLRHVGFWNQFVIKTLRGEKIDPKINELSKSEYPTKESLVKVLKSTVAEAAKLLEGSPGDLPVRSAGLWVSFIQHSGEHYGQMVVYYRLNGLVPPASR